MIDLLKQKLGNVGLILLQTFLLVGITLFAVIPFSCKVTTEGIEIIGGDYSAPVIEEVLVIDDKTVKLCFSESINLKNVVVSPFISGISDSAKHSETRMLSPSLAAATGEYGKIETEIFKSEDGKLITLSFNEKTTIGKTYEVFGTVEDAIGNTLTFCVPFTGYNSSVPRVIITEAQIKYQKGTSKGEVVYRGEFIEILALQDGNLAGIELLSAADGEEKKYEFPAIEVKRGEIVLVHLRTIGEGCVNETGEDLNLATAPHSKDGIRDLWVETNLAHYNDTSDIIYLRNSVNGAILDGVMYASPDSVEWKSSIAGIAEEVAMAGIYSSSDISNASSSKGCTTLKSLTRVESESILKLALSDEDFEYPVPSDENSWVVSAVTPGML